MNDPHTMSQRETGIRIRKATLADRDALIELTREVFAESGTEKAGELGHEFWDWQFVRQPEGRMDLWICELDGQLVAQMPMNITRLKWENRELLVAWVIDLMVHPAHRDKSLFVKMGRVANKELGETGVSLCLGLPNKKSYPGATRFLKYELVGQVPVLVLPMRWGQLLSKAGIPKWASPVLGGLGSLGHRLMRLSSGSGKGVTVREVDQFPEEVDELWRRASQPHKIISVRDHKYLTWRYCDCPTRAYRIQLAEIDGKLAGYLVHRVFEKNGLKIGALMDLLVVPGHPNVVQALLGKGIEALRGERVDAVVGLMQRDRFYYSGMRRFGFARLPERFNPRTFNLVCRVLSPELPKPELCSAKNWFVTLGDFDVY